MSLSSSGPIACLAFAFIVRCVCAPGQRPSEDVDWRAFGGDEQGNKFSRLTQINRDNVARLEIAWTYRHGDMERGGHRMISYETTPITFEGRLYLTTPFGRVVALDAATGEELWFFEPGYDIEQALHGWPVNRGVSLWRGEPDEARLFVAPIDSRLYCIDGRTGKPVESFGENGVVDLFATLETDRRGDRRSYSYTMPPTIYKDLVIVGSQIADSPALTRPPGSVRAFDARTGREVWSFQTIPREGEPGVETWLEESWKRSGSANVWSKLSVDVERGLIFAPTSTPNSDFYGGHRPGDNLYAESLVCLDAATGERKWHFQTVHHGIWDYDVNCQPNLIDIEIDGRMTPIVAQFSKTGFCYVFNRESGKPIWPIEERHVPASDTPGERASPTQPFPTKPPPIAPQGYNEEMLADLTPEHNARAREAFARYRSGPLFTPPSLQGTLTAPGYQGGASWGGAAFDPATGYLIVNSNHMAVVLRMVEAQGPNRPRYVVRGNRFIDPVSKVPFSKPPWGLLTAIDIARGEIAWQTPLGINPDVRNLGLDPAGTGAFNRGAPIVTASGLVFIGATEDGFFRAFDARDGSVLFEHKIPFTAAAVPATYRLARNGKQYVVIACGGHRRMHTELHEEVREIVGDVLVAFALP